MQSERKYFILITGLPGSGKTTLAEKIKQGKLWGQASAHVDFITHYNLAVKDGRIAVVDDPETMEEIDQAAQSNKVIIITDPNLIKKGQLTALSATLSATYKFCDIQALIFNPSLGICQENCLRRAWEGGHYISHLELDGFSHRFDPDYPSNVTVYNIEPQRRPWSHETMPALLLEEKVKVLGIDLVTLSDLPEAHYHEPHFIKEQWTRYTQDEGNYNGPGRGRIEGDTEPEFSAFDTLLQRLAPNLDGQKRQQLRSELVHTKEWEDSSDYYGNYSAYGVKYANLNEVALHLLKEGHFPEAQKLIDEAMLKLRKEDMPQEPLTSDVDLA